MSSRRLKLDADEIFSFSLSGIVMPSVIGTCRLSSVTFVCRLISLAFASVQRDEMGMMREADSKRLM